MAMLGPYGLRQVQLDRMLTVFAPASAAFPSTGTPSGAVNESPNVGHRSFQRLRASFLAHRSRKKKKRRRPATRARGTCLPSSAPSASPGIIDAVRPPHRCREKSYTKELSGWHGRRCGASGPRDSSSEARKVLFRGRAVSRVDVLHRGKPSGGELPFPRFWPPFGHKIPTRASSSLTHNNRKERPSSRGPDVSIRSPAAHSRAHPRATPQKG